MEEYTMKMATVYCSMLVIVICVLMLAQSGFAARFGTAEPVPGNTTINTAQPATNSRTVSTEPVPDTSWIEQEVAKMRGERDQAIRQRNTARKQVTNRNGQIGNLWKGLEKTWKERDQIASDLGQVTTERDQFKEDLGIAQQAITAVTLEREEAQKNADIAWAWSDGFQRKLVIAGLIAVLIAIIVGIYFSYWRSGAPAIAGPN